MIPTGFIPEPWGTAVVLLVLTLAIKFALDGYFASESGLAMRATGGNARMTRAVGVSTDRLSLAALALSNGIVAVAGALFAQSQGGADVSMGIGTIVIGLAAVIIGETILPGRTVAIATLGCIVGAVLYRLLIALGLNSDFIGLKAQDLNLVTAVLVAVALVLPASRRYLARRFMPPANRKKPGELEGESLACLYPSVKEFEHIGNRAHRVMRDKALNADERIMKRADGQIFWCRVAGRAIDRNALFSAAVWVRRHLGTASGDGQPHRPRARDRPVPRQRKKQQARKLESGCRSATARWRRIGRDCCASSPGPRPTR